MSLNSEDRVNNHEGAQPQEDYEYVITAYTFRYRGDALGLQSKINALNLAKNKEIFDIRITILGDSVKQRNTFCEIATLFFGIMLIFPIFFMCCKWWHKVVNPAYEVPLSTYKKLSGVFLTPKTSSITLKVTDNAFNAEKAKILHEILEKSSTLKFRFTNLATSNDFRENQFSEFETYMQVLTSLNIDLVIKWCNKIIRSKNIKNDEENAKDPDYQ